MRWCTYDDKVRNLGEMKANARLLAASWEMREAMRNAMLTLQIMQMPRLDNTVATNEDLAKILRDSFDAILKKIDGE
jgi:hypothetical protein